MTRETTTSTRTPKKATRGTVSYEDQTISTRAIALLAGQQHASIDVHGAGQQGARLSLTWGTLLLGFTAVDQVDALAEAFADSQSAAQADSRALGSEDSQCGNRERTPKACQ